MPTAFKIPCPACHHFRCPGPLKLNLGCGRRPMDGYVNVDRNPGPGVDHVLDLETERLPYPDGSAWIVHSSHFLEHPVRFEAVMEEIRRVLGDRGVMTAIVPYGLHANPYHRRFFDRKAIRVFTHPSVCGDDDGSGWNLVDLEITKRGFPGWTLNRLGLRFPVGKPKEMRFTLRKRTDAREARPAFERSRQPDRRRI